MSDTTEPPQSTEWSITGPGPGEVLALVLVWSRDEPWRAGDVLLVPAGAPGKAWTFGRDGASPDGRSGALGLARHRPGALEPTGPLACPRISRAQLRLSATRSGALAVENVGRCPLLKDGQEISGAELAPGDLVELRHEVVLLCARRPRSLPAPPAGSATLHAFGEPDAFGIVGEGPAAWELRRTIAAVARRPVHTLVLGASGSGKELVARGIHALSARRGGPLVARNAATIPESLIDAELFGHAKGFPNPGSPERPGLVGEADGGTLFLDEIGELPASQQAHLLRVLDDGEYHRLGEARARRADIRLVAATNRPGEALKHDVLARLKARVVVPSLGARREDIPLLVRYLVQRQARGDPSVAARFFPDHDAAAWPRVTPGLMTALLRRAWETNVRELDALLLRSTMESRGKYLDLPREARAEPPPPAAQRPLPALEVAADFTPEEQRRLALQRKHGFNAAACGRDPEYGASRQTADLHLRQLMGKALSMAGWDIAAAAERMVSDDEALRARLRGRIETFLWNLRRRTEEEGGDAVRKALSDEWRASAPLAHEILSAIEAGRIRGPGLRGS
jgi:two-component system nitrogen regulation response regulator GlnG/two-component system response regulator HydG